ncbi:fumarylacetoacetate hydrolase family protein [Paraburkholderia oxyphila]|uniref:fumarylacetoacetate hydrolase family protein n=1 Tax=Paraburkholderia oxyphila TaxID=614212 RepID=UPI000481453A|nr:fumarylacetoacetate hydrolase family protein [Paraburkholderia oxyphila]
MEFAVPAAPIYTLTVHGRSQRFPVNRVFCVGRNYAAHAREMGKDPDRDPPFFFMKPASAIVDAAAPISVSYPSMTSNYQYEVELVVAIDKGGFEIPVAQALEHVFGYAVGLDMTRRDLQLAARDAGRPWEFGKSFSDSAPIGALHTVADGGHVDAAAIELTVNGTVQQSSNVAKLIWSTAECIAHLSRYEALRPGDLIMTGTPEGVGPVLAGDMMRGRIDGLTEVFVTVDQQAKGGAQ